MKYKKLNKNAMGSRLENIPGKQFFPVLGRNSVEPLVYGSFLKKFMQIH